MAVAIDYQSSVLNQYHAIFHALFAQKALPDAFRDPLRRLAELLIPEVSSLNPKHKPRQMLGFCDQYELFFLEREPYDNSLAPHDHGQAWGLACVLEGCLQETTYQLKPNAKGDRLVPIPDQESFYYPGDIVWLKQGLIHVDSNPTAQRTISVNLFVPSIKGMRVYKPEGCCIVKPGVRPLKEIHSPEEIETWE